MLRPVSYIDSFEYDNNIIKFKVSSENGLEFFDNGLNSMHFYGIKKCYSKDKKRKYDIFYQYWLVNSSFPSILFFHGNAENSTTHPKFFYHLLLNGYNIFTFDNIGHGSSSGLRGSIKIYSDYIDIAKQIFSFFNNIEIQKHKNNSNDRIKNKNLSKNNIQNKWIIMGFSFGGLIATDFALNCESEEINNVILFSPWFMTHNRILNNIMKYYLLIFNRFFNSNNLINYDIQEDIFTMDDESYIRLNKNLTDNEKFLRIRKKDTRIFRVISKKRLSEIYKAQLILLNTNKKNNINFYSFLPEKDLIVDSETTKKFMSNFNGEFYCLNNFYHDFLDYSDERWDYFIKILNNCLTKIVK